MAFQLITPNKIVNHVKNITPEFLKSKGVTTVLLDLDNTLTRWNSNDIDGDVFHWIKNIKENGIRPCIVSNNKRRRIETVAEMLDIPFVYRASKPRKGAYRKALAVMNSTPENTAFIGDQIFTDVFGANRMKLYSILVKPIHPREFIGTRVMRRVERLVMKHIVPKE